MIGYLLRLLSVDAVIRGLSNGWKQICIGILREYDKFKSVNLRLEQKILLNSVFIHFDIPLVLEGKHLLKKGMHRE